MVSSFNAEPIGATPQVIITLSRLNKFAQGDLTRQIDIIQQVDPNELLPRGVRAALTTLAVSGAKLSTLYDICEAQEGFMGLPVLDSVLEQLCGRSLITLEETNTQGKIRIKVSPAPACLLNETIAATLVDNEQTYLLSKNAIIRPEKQYWCVESPYSPIVIHLHDVKDLPLVTDLVQPMNIEDIRTQFEKSNIRSLLPALVKAKILITKADETTQNDMPQWEFHDLHFHTRSRMGRHHYPYGGTYRGRDLKPQPSAIKVEEFKERITLPKPDLDLIEKNDPSFSAVLERRRSRRKFGDEPIGLEQLSEFLFRCCRVKSINTGSDGWQTMLKPTPSGGAVHELEVYPLVRSCSGLSPALYYYHPQDHQLCMVNTPNAATEQLLQAAWYTIAQHDHPQILFLITARFDRVFWKYQSMSYALVLKNVGILYQTMYLVGEAMGLSCCALGGGDSDLFEQASGRPYLLEGTVGEFVLGSRKSGEK